MKIDTGMARLGVREDAALTGLLSVFREAPELFFEGVFTHFATADEGDNEYFQMQVARFEHALSIIRAMGFSPVIHAGNSAVTLHWPQYHYDMVRPGYALYGYDPGPGDVGFLQPAMRWTTQIVNLKWIGPDEGVSYGVTYRTSGDTLVGTIPVGYADGYRRAIGNTGYVLVHGKRAPVIGRVCMDQTMIDLTGIPNVAIRDEVVLLGQQGKEQISANEMAAWQETIGYEVLRHRKTRAANLCVIKNERAPKPSRQMSCTTNGSGGKRQRRFAARSCRESTRRGRFYVSCRCTTKSTFSRCSMRCSKTAAVSFCRTASIGNE